MPSGSGIQNAHFLCADNAAGHLDIYRLDTSVRAIHKMKECIPVQIHIQE